MARKEINKNNIAFYIVYVVLAFSTLVLYVRAIQINIQINIEWIFKLTLKDFMEPIPWFLEAMLLNIFISIGIIFFSFCICSLLKGNESDSLRRIVTAFFCFILIVPGGIITHAFEAVVEYIYPMIIAYGKSEKSKLVYYNTPHIMHQWIIWLNLIIVTGIKLAGISLILLGLLKRIRGKISLLDTFKCSLIVGLINFATLSRIATNTDMWPSLNLYIGKGWHIIDKFESFWDYPSRSIDLWVIILEFFLVMIVCYITYLLIKSYLFYDEKKVNIISKKDKVIKYRLIGGSLGVLFVTLPFWIVTFGSINTSFAKFSINKLLYCIQHGVETGILTAIIGTLFIMIILVAADHFSKKIIAIGLLFSISLISVSSSNIGIGSLMWQLNLVKDPLGLALICGLNPISIMGILYFIITRNNAIKRERKSYAQLTLAIFIMKFISGFIAYGQINTVHLSREYQPLAYFYKAFGRMKSYDMGISGYSDPMTEGISGYSDPMTAGIMAAVIGIVIVLGMIGVSKLLEDEEGSNSVWLGILYK